MRVLLALLLVGIAGCGGESSVPGGGAGPTPEGVGRSELDGYIVQRGPGTIVQFNIPPKKVKRVHLVSLKHKVARLHRQGFDQASDWDLRVN